MIDHLTGIIEEATMHHAGIDLHKRFLVVALEADDWVHSLLLEAGLPNRNSISLASRPN